MKKRGLNSFADKERRKARRTYKQKDKWKYKSGKKEQDIRQN